MDESTPRNPDDEAAALLVDPELARMQARQQERRDDAFVRNPWSNLRLAWTAALFGWMGEAAWLVCVRAREGTRGLPEDLVANLGIDPTAMPEWMIRVGSQAGLGVMCFMAVSGVLLMERAGSRYAPTRHAGRVHGHRAAYRALVVVSAVVAAAFYPS